MAENPQSETGAAAISITPGLGAIADSPSVAPVPIANEATVNRKPLLRSWLRDFLVSLGISAFIIIFVYQPVKVEGTSMMPELADQERIFVNKFVYRLEPISRGDVIVFHYPLDPSKSFIKRVVAVAGDHVRIESGTVYVNGAALDEAYVPEEFRDQRSYPEIEVPSGSYFVLGDHRSLSNDSREFGPVSQDYVSGKAVFAYWPFDKAGRLR
ncbi:MAG TPA: signal peptidase I [Terriglobales bacterium]|nr:signal peptidase I [Terriglobales bacterium]